MKKIFFYFLFLVTWAITGCNNEDQKTDKDSINNTGKTDSSFDRMRSYFSKGNPLFNPDSSRSNLGKYPDLADKTQYVKFDYAAFLLYIDSLDKVFKTPATEIYLVYGAYTKEDVTRYLKTHITVPPLRSADILNKPTLLVGYLDPSTSQMLYKDFATICPPPASCQTMFIFPQNQVATFIGNLQAGFNADSTINNYRTLYDLAVDPLKQLTKSVKFDIAGIKYLVDSLDKQNQVKTNQIYFTMAAYTAADADNYVKTHPGTTTGEIVNKTCLLFTYKNPAVEGFTYFDFGTICPPPASCQTRFNYGN